MSMSVSSAVGNEKYTMQNLNDRLASYLAKVRSLEAANRKLELQIKEYCQKQAPVHKDLSGYNVTIEGLHKQIMARLMENSRLSLQIDNAKLAGEDFQLKYGNEVSMRNAVEADITRLKRVLSEFQLACKDVTVQIKGLKEELAWLKCNHKEELQMLRAQESGSVNVELDVAPPVDLEKVLKEVREQYEEVIQKNHQEAEKWFQGKVSALQTQMSTSATEVKTSQTQVADLRRTVQTLEIELQGLLTQKANLDQQVTEVSSRYGLQLSQLQQMINNLEAELQQLNISIQQQGTEYKLLLDIKMRLEREIAEYRRLLEGEGEYCAKTVAVEEEEDEPHRQRRVKVIVEEMVDGVVVSSSVDEKLQEIS